VSRVYKKEIPLEELVLQTPFIFVVTLNHNSAQVHEVLKNSDHESSQIFYRTGKSGKKYRITTKSQKIDKEVNILLYRELFKSRYDDLPSNKSYKVHLLPNSADSKDKKMIFFSEGLIKETKSFLSIETGEGKMKFEDNIINEIKARMKSN
jgi:hypothetical protein